MLSIAICVTAIKDLIRAQVILAQSYHQSHQQLYSQSHQQSYTRSYHLSYWLTGRVERHFARNSCFLFPELKRAGHIISIHWLWVWCASLSSFAGEKHLVSATMTSRQPVQQQPWPDVLANGEVLASTQSRQTHISL